MNLTRLCSGQQMRVYNGSSEEDGLDAIKALVQRLEKDGVTSVEVITTFYYEDTDTYEATAYVNAPNTGGQEWSTLQPVVGDRVMFKMHDSSEIYNGIVIKYTYGRDTSPENNTSPRNYLVQFDEDLPLFGQYSSAWCAAKDLKVV